MQCAQLSIVIVSLFGIDDVITYANNDVMWILTVTSCELKLLNITNALTLVCLKWCRDTRIIDHYGLHAVFMGHVYTTRGYTTRYIGYEIVVNETCSVNDECYPVLSSALIDRRVKSHQNNLTDHGSIYGYICIFLSCQITEKNANK